MSVPAAVGQTWASNRPQDIARGHNQERRVLSLTTKQRWDRASKTYDQVPAALLTAKDTMRTSVALKPDGSIPNHRLVSEPDPRLVYLANTLRGIETREPYGYADKYPSVGVQVKTYDLAEEALAALLWPRRADGTQNPRIEVVLHQDALLALTERVAELVEIIEQSAMAVHVGPLDSESEGE